MKRTQVHIAQTLKKVRRYWLAHPYMRLGQAISNLANEIDPFYIEDELLVQRINIQLDKVEENDNSL